MYHILKSAEYMYKDLQRITNSTIVELEKLNDSLFLDISELEAVDIRASKEEVYQFYKMRFNTIKREFKILESAVEIIQKYCNFD